MSSILFPVFHLSYLYLSTCWVRVFFLWGVNLKFNSAYKNSWSCQNINNFTFFKAENFTTEIMIMQTHHKSLSRTTDAIRGWLVKKNSIQSNNVFFSYSKVPNKWTCSPKFFIKKSILLESFHRIHKTFGRTFHPTLLLLCSTIKHGFY